MRKQFYRWQLQLDREGPRERVIIFLVIFLVIYVIWDLLLLSPITQRVDGVALQITTIQKEITGFDGNQQRIIADVANNANQELMQRYQNLQQQLATMSSKIKTYKFHTVSTEQMATMLQAVLQDIPGVAINSFKTITMAPPKPEEAKNKKLVKSNTEPPKPQQQYYELVIAGKYFSLQAFLVRLEHLDWQIYWDTFAYRVTHRPDAQITIKFHTLSLEGINVK